tara:strand:+ start:197 stop:637 length:441 start_codon:yes stop_codon:yes gene_type:complete
VDLPHAAKHNLTAWGNGPLAGSCKPWQGLTTTCNTASLFHEASNHLVCFDTLPTGRISRLKFIFSEYQVTHPMSTNSRLALSISLISLLLITPLSVAGSEVEPPKLFSDASEMEVRLLSPWNKIQKNVKKDARYPVQLTYRGTNGQ